MRLRELEEDDCTRMLEWMHDSSIVEKLRTNFTDKTEKDCRAFINKSRNDRKHSIHLAIVSNENLYMGTVSLKNITDTSGEFAIVLHRDAIGKGYAFYGMKEVLKIGFDELCLNYVYWCAANDNIRALKFYDKHGFKRCDMNMIDFSSDYTSEEATGYIWYKATSIPG